MLSNTLRIKIRYLKLIHFLHPRYHPKIIGDILKNVKKKNNKKTSAFVTYSSTDSWRSPIPVSDWLKLCCGNLILHQKRKGKWQKYKFSDEKTTKKCQKSKWKH